MELLGKRRKPMMKTKRNLISVALLSALLLVGVLLALPGTAKAPSSCRQACVARAEAAANACLALTSGQAACLEAVQDQLKACLATCH
jgi:hypothetical protein